MRRLWMLVLVLLGACARLDYPALGIHEAVVRGGQAQIDQGKVVDVDTLPGIWLAAHRSTHGSVFANLVNARLGDEVCVYSVCYHVVRILTYPEGVEAPYLGSVVLQTSLDGDTALLVVAEP